jgi:hypothetical protein
VLSSVILVTAFVSLIGCAIDVLVILALLSRGRKRHHILFSLLLLPSAFFDLGIFLIMIRNNFPDEIILYQNIFGIALTFFPAFIYHFTTTYLNQPRKKTTIALYSYCIAVFIPLITGIVKTYSGVYRYSWGNIAKWEPLLYGVPSPLATIPSITWNVMYHLSILISCWLLVKARKNETSPVTRRHIEYIIVSFVIFSLASVKAILFNGIDVPFTLPLGMLLCFSVGAVIGVAIVKDRLFDITVLVRKGTIYSVLTALILFIFDFTQHLAATFFEGLVGEHSGYIHYIPMAVVIIAFMPLKQRLEHTIGTIFEKKKIEF